LFWFFVWPNILLNLRFLVYRLAQDMNLLIQNRGVLFRPAGFIKHLAFFGCPSHFCLHVANKNMLRVLDSPTQDTQVSCSSPQIKTKDALLGANVFICGDGGNRTPVQTMLLWESTMRRILILEPRPYLSNICIKYSKSYITDALCFFAL